MAKIFYDHLIVIEEVIAVLDTHKLSPTERSELLSAVDQTLHHHILDVILTHLPKEHHQMFLTRFQRSPGDQELLTFLKEHTDIDIERAILKRANEVKRKVLTTIHHSKKGQAP